MMNKKINIKLNLTDLLKKNGFTLVELMIVIAIIGILSGIVLVGTGSSVEKSKRSSAVATMSSILPELVTCEDDNGVAINSAAPTANTPSTTNTYVCCASGACGGPASGHSVKWPDIKTKTGWAYVKPTGSLNVGDYAFTANKNGQTDIKCSYADNSCE
jgi:prepilin-type N-terminal cleavage/methylation domain-containing protein